MFRMTKKYILLGVALLLALTGTATAFGGSNAYAQTANCNQTYFVQKGDWLSTIAQKFLGDATSYQAILDATNNAAKTDSSFATIADANKIEVGQKLCIPAVTSVPGRELSGIYTTVGPAADASALVETLVLGGDGQARYTLDYIGKASIYAKGTWKQDGNTVTVSLYEQAGKAVQQTMTFTVKDGNLVATAAPNATYAKTAPNVAFYSGLYTTNRPSADASETLTALALMPDGSAQLTSSSTKNPFILKTGTWQVAPNKDTGTDSVTVKLTKQGDAAIDETFVFQTGDNLLRGTQYDTNKWGTNLTFTKFNAPAEPVTPANPGGQTNTVSGIYTTVGPAADASALVETLTLADDGGAQYSLDYVGKAKIDAKGTWKQDGDTVTVTLTEQAGKPVQQTMAFTVKNGNLVATAAPNATYAKTSAEVAKWSGLYTTNRKSADGSESLTALALLPDGTAQLTSSTTANPFILKTGTWQVGPNPDTGADSITVKLNKQGDAAIAETFVFQADPNLLRGTQYDTSKWGTDLTFTKFNPPAEPETPANSGGATGGASGPTGHLVALTGTYVAQLPAADAIGRVIQLDLQPNNTATLTTQFIGKGAPTVEQGTWANDTGNMVVTLGKQTLTFVFDGGTLVLQNPVDAGYGSDGLKLERVGSDRFNQADFGGVTFTFDNQLAQSAKGENLDAIPVTEGPAFGGARPAQVRFLFNGAKPDDFFNPHLAQVDVFKTDDWSKLDPAIAQQVTDLQALLKDKPATFPKYMPFLPPANAQQVLHAQAKYLDFQNGSGVSYITYYAQDVSPVTADQIFYTFQGLTSDGKYYVQVFYPITTSLLPKDANTALGGASYDEWTKNYTTYLSNLTKDLNGLLPAAYSPNLTLIDNLVQSLQVADTTLQ